MWYKQDTLYAVLACEFTVFEVLCHLGLSAVDVGMHGERAD